MHCSKKQHITTDTIHHIHITYIVEINVDCFCFIENKEKRSLNGCASDFRSRSSDFDFCLSLFFSLPTKIEIINYMFTYM